MCDVNNAIRILAIITHKNRLDIYIYIHIYIMVTMQAEVIMDITGYYHVGIQHNIESYGMKWHEMRIFPMFHRD